jgi:hypothetical protein
VDPVELRHRLAQELDRSRRAIAVARALVALAAELRRSRRASAERPEPTTAANADD